MRSIRLAVALVLLPVALAAQKPPTPPVKAAPSKAVSTAFAREQEVWNAIKAGNIAEFDKLVNGPFTYIDRMGIVGWTAKQSETLKDCTLVSFLTEDVHTQQPAAGVVILSYKLTQDMSCKGAPAKEPSPLYVMSVWQRTASSWRLVAHSETAAEQPKQ